MAQLRVVLDACVLYSAPLRDTFLRLAIHDLFQARWTDRILDEWVDNLVVKRPDLNRPRLERTRRLMNTHVQDAIVTGYEPLIETVTLPDADDRHVFAAAIHCNATLIITFNLKDFPPSHLAQYGVEAQHPDQFILGLLTANTPKVCAVLRRQRSMLMKPPVSVDDFLGTLSEQGLGQTVEALGAYRAVL